MSDTEGDPLRTSEVLFREMADAAPAMLWLTDPSGECTLIARGWCEFTGQGEREALGFGWLDALHPDDREAAARAFRAASEAREPFVLDCRVRRADGEYRWVLDTGRPRYGASGEFLGFVGNVLDVTDRKRAEAALRDRELRYRLVADASNDVIWDWNLRTDHIVWNDGVRARFGYAPEAVRGDGAWWVERVHPDDRDRVVEGVRAHIERGPDEWQGEYRFRRADGSYAWVLDRARVVRDRARVVRDRARVVRDGAGRAARMVGSMLDLTERRRAEAALRASEERFAFVRRSSGVGFWYCDLPFDVLEWDEQVKAHFHLPPGARVTIDDFYARLHPDDREPTRRAIERSIAARVPYDVNYRTVDPATGERKWIRAIGRTFYDPDGTPRRFDGVTVDVTAQKGAAEAVEFLAGASASLAELVDYESTLQRIADLAVAAFADWCVVDVLDEHGGRRRLQATRQEAASVRDARAVDDRWPPLPGDLHGVPWVLRTGDSELVESVPDALLESVAQGAEHLAALRARGVRSYICVPLLSRGSLLGGMTFLTAASGRRYGPDDLRVAEDLARRVSVALENARLYSALKAADRRKDEFLATLAHELRNPLAPVRNALQILRVAPDAESARRAREMMERQLGHMVRLIDDLLDVSRITQGKVTLKRERVAVRAVLDAAVEASRPLVEAARHALTVTAPDEPLWLDADLTRLAQVVSNLLTNAAKYTPDGGRIELSAAREGGSAVIRVTDTGVGIPRDMLDAVFEMFAQVNRTLDRAQGGLGIGLALVRRLVEMHGGTIRADSPGVGQGSTFTVTVPLAEGAAGARAEPDAGARASGAPGRRRVLVVDDNVDGAESLAMLLELLGHEARVAHDGPGALSAAAEYRPEVVFLDIGMPGMSGYEVAARLRGDPSHAGAVLVALTGWGSAEDKRRSREAGFDLHLTKPVDASVVEGLLARLPPRAPA